MISAFTLDAQLTADSPLSSIVPVNEQIPFDFDFDSRDGFIYSTHTEVSNTGYYVSSY